MREGSGKVKRKTVTILGACSEAVGAMIENNPPIPYNE